MRRCSLACAAALAAFAMIGCAALPKHIANYSDVVAKMDRVVVMPPDFAVEKAGMFTTEAQSELNHDVAMATQRVFEQLVEESRYRLARLNASDSALTLRPELRQRLGENSKAVAAAFTGIMKTKGKVLDVDFRSNLDYFANETGAEHMLMVSGEGWYKSGGTLLAGILLFGAGAATGSSTTLRAMLVDATSGKVLWYNEVTKADKDPRKPSQLMKVAQTLMKPLTGESNLTPDTSHDKDIIEKYKDLGKPQAARF
jgi:hypothetical protein